MRTVSSDPDPAAFLAFPRMDTLEIRAKMRHLGYHGDRHGVRRADADRECDQRATTIVNIDHHLGNTGYGTVNWFDEGAAACVELVADAIDAIGIAWTSEIATYLYLGLSTDTGSFRHSHITARSFELASRCVLAGADPVSVGQTAYDSFSLGRVRLIGELLHGMQLEAEGRLAVLTLTPDVHARAGSSPDETEGLINIPFTAQDVRAVCLLRSDEEGVTRVSLRSKGAVDVRAVAQRFGGGGHMNASGFTSTDPIETVRAALLPLLRDALR